VTGSKPRTPKRQSGANAAKKPPPKSKAAAKASPPKKRPARKAAGKGPAKAPAPPGRPPEFTEALQATFLDLIRGGMSMRQACMVEGMVSRETVRRHLAETEEVEGGFCGQYARACEERTELRFDECIEIADNSEGDTILTDKGYMPNFAKIQRDRLRIDTRKYYVAIMEPKKYGKKPADEGDGGVVVHVHADGKSPEENEPV
jgi:hypothetical protein